MGEISTVGVLAFRQPHTVARVRAILLSSNAAPITWRSSPNAFSMVGAPTSSAAIFATHALIADVLTSTTATSPQCSSTRLPQALRRVAAVLGEMWPCAADHDLYTAPTVTLPASGVT
jgi:hypothetical protein